MSDCIVLNDTDVHDLLINLSKPEIQLFIDKISRSLQDFSVGGDRQYQPDPSVVNRPDGRKNLFRCFTSSTGVGVKIIVDPARALLQDERRSFASEAEKHRLTGLHGVLALCDENGFASGFINAEEVTGHRTSVSAILLYTYRKKTDHVVVFGAGKQALWHTRLILALRGDEIRRVTFVNRSRERMEGVVETLRRENEAMWKSPAEFEVVVAEGPTPEVEEVVGRADVVFCTTPSREVLFPARCVTGRENDRGCYVSAIGSWQADMIELDPEILNHAVGLGGGKGIVVVDDAVECRNGTGEVIRSNLSDDQIVEVGKVLAEVKEARDEVRDTVKCLEEGFVVYKSVGVSVTDLAAGQALLEIARERKLGTSIGSF